MSERLTKRDENGNAYYDWGCLNRNHWALGRHVDRLAAYEDSGLTPEEVQELAQAKADGRLAILPLKVGDTIYRPEALQYSWDIVSATIYPDEIVFTDDSDNVYTEADIGKTVFLTREAAEKALGGVSDGN